MKKFCGDLRSVRCTLRTACRYLPYMKRSHLSIPLYSLRFLSAVRPKHRSNSVWELSTSTRHLGGSWAAAPKAGVDLLRLALFQ